MKKLKPLKIWHKAIIAVVAFVVMIIGLFALDEYVITPKQLPRNVVVHGVSLGSFTQSGLQVYLNQLIETVETKSITFAVDYFDATYIKEVSFSDLSLQVDTQQIADQINTEYFFMPLQKRFWFWLEALGRNYDVSEAVSFDEAGLMAILQQWEPEIGLYEAFEGGVSITEEAVSYTYPAAGELLNLENVYQQAFKAAMTGDREEINLAVVVDKPLTTVKDLELLVQKINYLKDNNIVFKIDTGEEVYLEPNQLVQSLLVVDTPDGLALSVDSEKFESYLPYKFVAPEPASFLVVSDTVVEVVPSRPGTTIDYKKLSAELARLYDKKDTIANVVMTDRQADFSTQKAQSLNINHLVAQYTTYHPCCADRVKNIQQMARMVDDTLLLPGESFSLNEVVGQRTEEKGFYPAGTIVSNALVDTIGGGVSQFATTIFNAIFWSGYKIDTHRPHSWYFTRYPEGVEATISWPAPNLIFTNDTDDGLLIKTSHTPSSVTVSLYGNNGGRIIKGSYRDGVEDIDRVVVGTSDARRVILSRGERKNVVEYEVLQVPDFSLAYGQTKVTQSGEQGWELDIKRTITKDNTQYDEQTWKVRYKPRPHIVSMHPCLITTYRYPSLDGLCQLLDSQ